MKKCPNCGYFALIWSSEYKRWECYDCHWNSPEEELVKEETDYERYSRNFPLDDPRD